MWNAAPQIMNIFLIKSVMKFIFLDFLSFFSVLPLFFITQDSMIDRFEHLGILIQFFKDGHEEIPLRQAISFFANSDENKPNLSDPAKQISEWFLQNIDVSLEYSCHKVTEKENGQHNASDGSSNQPRIHVVSSPLPDVIECISKISVVKKGHDIKGSSVKVINMLDYSFLFFNGGILNSG